MAKNTNWNRACPGCGREGVEVTLDQVIDSLAVNSEGRVGPEELFLDVPIEWAACAEPTCTVAWFSEDGHTVGRDQLRAHDLHVLRYYRLPAVPPAAPALRPDVAPCPDKLTPSG